MINVPISIKKLRTSLSRGLISITRPKMFELIENYTVKRMNCVVPIGGLLWMFIMIMIIG